MLTIRYFIVFFVSFAFFGCGFSSQPQDTQNKNAAAIVGPVTYDKALSKIRKKQLSASVNYVSTEKLSASTDYSALIDGAAAIGEILAPEAFGVFIALGDAGFDFWDDNYANDPSGSAGLKAINAKIAMLTNQLLATDTFTAMLAYNQNKINAGSAYYNYLQYLANIMVYADDQNATVSTSANNQQIGNTGQNPLANGGSSATLYNNFYSNLIINSSGVYDLNLTSMNAAAMSSINSKISARLAGANQAAPATIINTISGSTLTTGQTTPNFVNVIQDNVSPIAAPPVQTTTNGSIISNCDTGGDLPGLLQCLYGAFYYTYISNTGMSGTPPNLINNGNATNLANAIDTYNNSIVMIYMQSLATLQTVYQIESNINTLNYYSYVNCVPNANPSAYQQISFVENNDATYFTMPICNNNTAEMLTNASNSFITAQENLAMYYASRMNGLYDYMMNFIISDPLVNGQSYTKPAQSTISILGQTISIPPQSSLYKTISTTLFTNLPWANILSANNSVFYQYPGLANIYSCNDLYQITSNKFSNTQTTSCTLTPVASQDMNSSYYDGNYINLYTPSGSNNFALTNTLDHIDLCMQNTGVTLLKNLLMCQQYGYKNFFPNMAGITASFPQYPFEITHDWDYGTIYLQGQASNLYTFTPQFVPIQDDNASNKSNLFSTFQLMQSPFAFTWYAGWSMSVSNIVPSAMGLSQFNFPFQTTLPSGVVFPYYLITTTQGACTDYGVCNSSIGAAYSCFAPAYNQNLSIPGIQNCASNNTGMTVTDVYGNTYTFQDSNLYNNGTFLGGGTTNFYQNTSQPPSGSTTQEVYLFGPMAF